MPGAPRSLLQICPVWVVLAFYAILVLVAARSARGEAPGLRLAAALVGVAAVILTIGAAGDALTPLGNKVVRVSPGAASGCCSLCLGLMATDAITRLRPGPGLRVAVSRALRAAIAAVLASGLLDHLSVMREYEVNATAFRARSTTARLPRARFGERRGSHRGARRHPLPSGAALARRARSAR